MPKPIIKWEAKCQKQAFKKSYIISRNLQLAIYKTDSDELQYLFCLPPIYTEEQKGQKNQRGIRIQMAFPS